MSDPSIVDQTAKFLLSLKHTGPGGFEGLVVVLLEAATGQRFRLSHSGQQFGQDARSESQYGNSIKVEVKHYSKSQLDSRELAGELSQAISLGAALDLWVLAASCAVGEQISTQLEKIGSDQNVEVFLLDAAVDGLSRIAVLMAAFPEVLDNWIRQNNISYDALTQLHTYLQQLGDNPAFSSAKKQMQDKLSSTLLGYEDARRRARERFLRALSDEGNAVAHFGQRIALRFKGSRFISRLAITQELMLWWSGVLNECKHAVVLGEEGTGKTWAGLDWLATNIEANRMPLVLPFSANAESISKGETIADLLPRLLEKWTETGNVQFWAKRLKRWLKFESTELSPLLLVFADGLGERPSVSWPSFFRTLEDETWRGRVLVLATDRQGHWRPNCAIAGLDRFREIKIEGYTDWELEQALKNKEISLASIPSELLKLMRRPRYCELVCTHFDEMQTNADFTVERLIFLDVRHRTAMKHGELTQDQFIEIIRNLATKYRDNPVIQLNDLPELWPLADPDRTIHQRIIDGGLLIPKEGLNAKFTAERHPLVFGLGMLLADEIQSAGEKNKDRVQIENLITSWFEPHPEMDLKVEICGAALFHSLITEGYPGIGRREILRYWLTLRNWNDTAQSAIVNYVVRCPEDFIAVADEFWSSNRNAGAAQDFLAKAFTKYRDDIRVQPLLVPAVRRWMGFVHRAGHPFLRRDVKQREKIQQEIEQRVGSPLRPGSIETCGEFLTVVEDDDLLRMKRFGFLIISAGARAPFLGSFAAWAISSAVMGSVMEAELAEWIIYLSEEPLAELLNSEVERLLILKIKLALKAAITLLWRIDPKRAKELCEETGDQQYKERQEMRALHAQDPCKSFFAWSDEDCLRCQERTDINALSILDGLRDRIFNPELKLSELLVSRLARLLKFDPTRYRADLWATIEDHAAEKILPVLGSRAPGKIADFIRAVVCSLPNRARDNQYPLLLSLPELSILFTKAEVEVVSNFLNQIHDEFREAGNTQQDGGRWDAAEAFAFLAIAPHVSSDELFSRLIRRPPDVLDLYRFEPWFDALPADGVESALRIVHSPPDDLTLMRTLWFLAHSTVNLAQSDRDRILILAQSQNPGVRSMAMRFACAGSDETLRTCIVDLGSSFHNRGGDSAVVWGARILIRSSAHLPFASVALRLHPADAGYALVERDLRPNEVSEYAGLLDNIYQSIMGAIDPALLTLPSIVAPSKYDSSRRSFPEFATQEPELTFKSPDLTWRTLPQAPADHPDFDSTKAVEELNRLSRERASAISQAWKTDAFQWFGWGFSSVALGRICRDLPELVNRWVEPVFQEGRSADKIRLRLGSFLGALCPLLLEYDPPLGLKLWQVLRSGKTGPVVFDAVRAAFEAPDNDCTFVARLQLLEECNDDAAISRVAYLAEERNCRQWLTATIQRLIVESPLGKKAKGLTLASFSNIKREEFETYVTQANLGETWLASQLPTLRKNLQQNDFAQKWFKAFLEADERVAWGSLQMLLSCGDHRFFTWRDLYLGEQGSRHPRLRFLDSMGREIETKLDRSKERRDTLFGIKIERGEIYPFIDRSR
jgi:hypothetical protein